MNRFSFAPLLGAILISVLVSLGQTDVQAQTVVATPAPIRFLLTFDDGPSASEYDNPTEKILSVLKNNSIQPDIKAIFFTQTQAKGAGGSEHGRALLKQIYASGHELAFHTATSNHANHRFLTEAELSSSLKQGISDLSVPRGSAPQLVRPPFWSYDEKTLAIYHENNLQMLLTDLSANDGVIYVFNFSFTKRKNMRKMLLALRPRWQAGELPSVDGATPIVVTFHDINRYTANHMAEYLEILLDVARELEMPTTASPFYDQRDEMLKAALLKTTKESGAKQDLPGIWNWFWSWF
jgi:peptidoglycan/xylan/chitin deacetylase (PgdA/CDA1 family)